MTAVIILIRLGEDAIQRKQEEEQERKQQEKDQEATWYHEGPDVLKDARFWIAGKEVFVFNSTNIFFY